MTDFGQRFARCLELFSQARDKDGRELSMLAFGADAGGERENHVFARADEEVDLRSVSKVVVGLVLGSLLARQVRVGDGPMSLDTRAEPLLSRHMSEIARRQWARVRIVDLLNNTIGHEEGFFFQKDLREVAESDYLEYVFSSPLAHAPGTHFSYSNVGPYLFSVIVQDWLGRSLHDVARDLVLEPLGIESRWRAYGEYSAGCTGLSMTNADLIKLACLLRAGGDHDGRSIVPRSWIEEMASPKSMSPRMFDATRVFPKYGYGIGLWVCRNGTYYCDGTNGQYLIVIPARQVALSTTGDQPDMKPITRCMLPFVDD